MAKKKDDVGMGFWGKRTGLEKVLTGAAGLAGLGTGVSSALGHPEAMSNVAPIIGLLGLAALASGYKRRRKNTKQSKGRAALGSVGRYYAVGLRSIPYSLGAMGVGAGATAGGALALKALSRYLKK